MMPRENLVMRAREGIAPESLPVEVVERKGLGHPDTLCDAVAERICVRLCRNYLDRFGVILHHNVNVDKVLLCGGSSRASFGGGEIVEPMELYLAGRAEGLRVRGAGVEGRGRARDVSVECAALIGTTQPDCTGLVEELTTQRRGVVVARCSRRLAVS